MEVRDVEASFPVSHIRFTCTRAAAEAHQRLFLEQRRVSIVHEHGSDAEEQQLTEAMEEREEMSVLNRVPIAIPHAFHRLIQPDTDVCHG